MKMLRLSGKKHFLYLVQPFFKFLKIENILLNEEFKEIQEKLIQGTALCGIFSHPVQIRFKFAGLCDENQRLVFLIKTKKQQRSVLLFYGDLHGSLDAIGKSFDFTVLDR